MNLWLRPSPPAATNPAPVDVRWFHSRLPGYRPTPTLQLNTAGTALDSSAPVLLKHERDRFGLPSFKPLGASWAVYELLRERLGDDLDTQWSTIEQLRELVQEHDDTRRLTLVTATDGNHGRGVAKVAALIGLGAHIFVPEGTATARIEAIASEGATVEVVDGDYDATVATAAATASEDRVIVSDTSWPGYTTIPANIAAGYSTLFHEADQTCPEPAAVIVPAGVGALVAAAIAHYAGRAHIIVVEPTGADCITASLRADEPVTVPGPHTSTMAGLNCGTVSLIAWPLLREHVTASVVIDDDDAFDAMRLAANQGIVLGETGAAALGALLSLQHADSTLRSRLGLNGPAPVLLLGTEAATDPEHYAHVVGTSADLVSERQRGVTAP